MISQENAVILIAEDRPDDVLLIRKALAAAKVTNPFVVLPDGEQTMAYLDGVGQYADRKMFPMPNIMLLDLKEPLKEGQTVKGTLVFEKAGSIEVPFAVQAMGASASH